MNWRDEWFALSQRIRGLIEAGSVYARLQSEDSYRGSSELRHQASKIYDRLDCFSKEFSHLLPSRAKISLDGWIESRRDFFSSRPRPNAPMDEAALKAMLPSLAALESELTYHLADSQEMVRRRSERAFVHLRRLIVADSEVRRRWCDAFRDGEVSCEKLGAAHLLLHGIWAFKANAEGARTDLIFQEPITDDTHSEIERAAEGLVLTEWKVARAPTEVEEKFKKAREQAARYAGGALAGIELTAYRYTVVVSKHQKSPPEDIERDGTVYRHINIAVDPKPPSKG